MKGRDIKYGLADQSTTIEFVDSTGASVNGVDHATSGLTLYYRRLPLGTVTTITPAALAALSTAHTDGGVEPYGSGGLSRVDLPDAAVASGAIAVEVWAVTSTAIGLPTTHTLTAFDPIGTDFIAEIGNVDWIQSESPGDFINNVVSNTIQSTQPLDSDGMVTLLARLSALVVAQISADAASAATNALTAAGHGTTLVGRVTAARAGYWDKLNVTGNVASQTDVAALPAPPTSQAIRNAMRLAATGGVTVAAGSIDDILASGVGLASGQRVKLDAAQPDYAPAKAGDAMALTTGERNTVAGVIESHLLNEGDGQMLVNAIVGAIGNTNMDQVVLVAAIRADLERTGGELKLLRAGVNATHIGGQDAPAFMADAIETGIQNTTPLNSAGVATLLTNIAAVGTAIAALPAPDNAGIATLLTRVPNGDLATWATRGLTMIEVASGSVYRFTVPSLANAPAGEGGGGNNTGPGADDVTIRLWADDPANTIPLADADVWISTDADGVNVIAGTLQTNSAGEVTFLLDAGVTYYLWAQKDGSNAIRGASFTAEAD